MGKIPKFKATLRKTPAKAETPADVTSESREAVSSNPWTNETSAQKTESLSRQVSKASSQPQTASPAPRESDNASDKSAAAALSSHLDVPGNSVVPAPGLEEPPKARRKKTITKTTPHTFELEDELNSIDKQPNESTEQQKPDVSNISPNQPPQKPPPTSPFSFSPLRTTLNLPPTDPPLPTSPRPRSAATPIPNNPFSPARHRKSSSTSQHPNGNSPLTASLSQPYRFIPASQPPDPSAFFNKVVLITHGASLVSSSLIRQFHSAGARVIFGDTNADKARKLISSLGPPDTVHFNKCDAGRYEDIVELFKLATTMYGRVDHAIFGVGDDGGAARGVGEGEKLWGLDFGSKGRNTLGKEVLGEVESENDVEGMKMGEIVSASVRFARVAMAYLKHTPKGPRSKRQTTTSSVSGSNGSEELEVKVDRSLTFVTSTAGFKGLPNLTLYQVAAHAVLGVVRSLKESVDVERDGVRVNAVLTNVMIPTARTMVGGRMSVQLPVGRVEDVSRVIAAVVGDGGVIGHEGGGAVHGRALYVIGDEAVDVEDGLRRSEGVWLGEKGREALGRAEEGWLGGAVEWMLMDGLD